MKTFEEQEKIKHMKCEAATSNKLNSLKPTFLGKEKCYLNII